MLPSTCTRIILTLKNLWGNEQIVERNYYSPKCQRLRQKRETTFVHNICGQARLLHAEEVGKSIYRPASSKPGRMPNDSGDNESKPRRNRIRFFTSQ
jgi:hypothetical protein